MRSAIFITARLKSTRLPLKVMKDIKGRPMISHMIDRLKLAERPELIVMCTSPVAQDDPLEEVAAKEGIECFRGDPDDVLLRLKDAAELFNVDTVISCTADNPFVDPVYIDRLIEMHEKENYDYTNILGLPFGVFSYALSYTAMVKACEIKNEKDTEVWGGYFTETGLFKTGTLMADEDVNWPELRLTVDTPEDFELVEKIFDELYHEGEVFPLEDIVRLCRERAELVQINASIKNKPGLPIKLKK